jgi:hypothetical protein
LDNAEPEAGRGTVTAKKGRYRKTKARTIEFVLFRGSNIFNPWIERPIEIRSAFPEAVLATF